MRRSPPLPLLRLLLPLFVLLLPDRAAAQTPLRAPGIDAADDRVPVDIAQMPWRAIGKVQTNLATSCTGTLIGARLVLTAGHCLYQKARRQLLPVSSLHFLAGVKGGDFAAHALVIRVEHASGLLALLRGESRELGDDWAVLVLDQPLGERFGILPLARTPLPPGTALKSAGYAQDHRLKLMADPDCRTLPGAPGGLIGHDCEVTHGNSGGPLLVQQDGQWMVAGIVQGQLRFADRAPLAVAVDVAVLRQRLAAWQ